MSLIMGLQRPAVGGIPLSSPPMIAVVDDDIAIRDSLDSLMRAQGFLVAVYSSANDFLTGADFSNTDYLITDVQMPEMGGIELHEHLMALDIHIPTIFMTAFPSDSIRKRAMTGAAVCFLAKPFTAQALIDCLNLSISD
jgi:FixJ family two-component response regulator